jgi:formate dehydrogenase subunit gamma
MTAESPVLSPTPSAGRPARILRFTRTERTAHWVQATTFLILMVTGFALMLPQIEATIGHRDLLRQTHLACAFFFFFGPAIIALAGNRASFGEDIREVDTWDQDDLRWLAPHFSGSSPPQGRFNAGQKLNAIFVVWSTIMFSGTGLILWQNRRFPFDVVSQANAIHTGLAYIALAAFLGHVFLATLYPSTRHAFRAITQGWVSEDWAEQHHVKWVRRRLSGVSQSPPPYDALRTAAQILLGSWIALFASRMLFFGLGANTTDRVTEWLYNLTAWPGVAQIRPETGVHIDDWPATLYLAVLVLLWLGVDRLRALREMANPAVHAGEPETSAEGA